MSASNAVAIGPEVNLVAITKHKKFSGYSRCSRPLKTVFMSLS